MTLVRNTIFILLALFIDGLQAVISWGVAAIAAFPVTSGGTAAGCLAGSQVAGQIGCWAGGLVVGLLSVTPFGLAANASVAFYTVPVGIAVGIAVSMCLSLVLGWSFLVPLMYLFGANVSWKRLVWGGGEMIPGLNNIPFWTFFTIASLWDGSTGKKRRSIMALAGAALVPAKGIAAMRTETATLARSGARNRTPQREEQVPQTAIEQDTEQAPSPQRAPLQDIRPFKPNVQAT